MGSVFRLAALHLCGRLRPGAGTSGGGERTDLRTWLGKTPSHLAEKAEVSSSKWKDQTISRIGSYRPLHAAVFNVSVSAPDLSEFASVWGSRSAPAASLPGVNLVSKNGQNKLKTVKTHRTSDVCLGSSCNS